MTINDGKQKFSKKNKKEASPEKNSICAYLGCLGRNFLPDADCYVCGASIHLECSPKVSIGGG
jgi:hypothetical protein